MVGETPGQWPISYAFFINGEKVYEVPETYESMNRVPFEPAYLSIECWDSENVGIHGLFDEIGVWNRPLSDSEIGRLYADGRGLFYPFV